MIPKAARRSDRTRALALAAVLAAPAARGDEFHWAAPAGGPFAEPAHWSPAATPGAADTAVFDLGAAAPYAVTVASGPHLAGLDVRGDRVRFELGGDPWLVDAVRIGSAASSSTTQVTLDAAAYANLHAPTLTIDRSVVQLTGEAHVTTLTTTLGDGADVTLADRARLGAGQVLRVGAGASLTTRTSVYADHLDLAGTLRLAGGEFWADTLARAPGGTFDWTAGTFATENLRFGDGGFFGRELVLAENRHLRLFRGPSAGTLTLDAGSRLTLDGGELTLRTAAGPGAFDFRRGTLQLAYADVDTAAHPLLGPDYALTGPRALVVEASATIPAGARVTVGGGGSFRFGGLTVRGEFVLPAGGTARALTEDGIVVDADSPTSAPAALELTGGAVDQHTPLVVARDHRARVRHAAGQVLLEAPLRIGANAGSRGEYALAGGQFRARDQFIGDGGTGVFHQTGGSNTPFRGYVELTLGKAPTGDGTYRIDGGTLDLRGEMFGGPVNGRINVGVEGTGRFVQGGGDVVAGYLRVAERFDSTGAVEIGGGTFTVDGAHVGGGGGTFTQTGGRVTLGKTWLDGGRAPATLNLAGGTFRATSLELGYSGDAVVDQTGGDAAVSGEIVLGRAAYRLSGGSLAAGTIRINDGHFSGVPATFDYAGGRLRADVVWVVGGAFRAAERPTLTIGTDADAGTLVATAKSLVVADHLGVGPGGTLTLYDDVLRATAVTQTGGTIDAGLWNHTTYDYHAGDFPGFLVNFGTVTAHADFTVGSLDNRAGLAIPAGRTWTVRHRLTTGDRLELAGRLSAGAEDFTGSGTFAQAAGVNAVAGNLQFGIAAGDDFTYDLRGPGAALDARSVTVGVAGRAALRVSGGATAGAGELTVADRAGSAAALEVRGAGTRVTTGAVIVGRGGAGSLVVADGAVVDSAGGRALGNASADPTAAPRAAAAVTGPGSAWTGPGALRLAFGASLDVADGGLVESGDLRTTGSVAQTATVRVGGVDAATGARATLALGGDRFGYAAHFADSGNGQLVVRDGGLVRAAGDFRVASRNATGRGDVVVAGAAGGHEAGLRVDGKLHLANDDLLVFGPGGTAQLTVGAGGRVEVSDTTYVGGRESVAATLAVDGGTFRTGGLAVAPNGTVSFAVGSGAAGAAPDEAAPVVVDGDARLGGVLAVVLAGGVAARPGDRFTLLTGGWVGRFHGHRGLELGPGDGPDHVRHLLPVYEPTRLSLVATESLVGDASADGVVDYADFAVLRDAWGWSAATYARGDFTFDGVVGAADFLTLFPRLTGLTAGQRAEVEDFARTRNVPEPGGALWFLAPLLPGRRRRRGGGRFRR